MSPLTFKFQLICMSCCLTLIAYSADVPVDFGGNPFIQQLPDSVLTKMKALRLQDLNEKREGRYHFEEDDGPSGYWSLETINRRMKSGNKPYAQLCNKNGVQQNERVIFNDNGTGAQMMMLTQNTYGANGHGDQLFYYGKGSWSANGAYLLWYRSPKPGLWSAGTVVPDAHFGPMVANGNGSNYRILKGNSDQARMPVVANSRPDIAYAVLNKSVVEWDLKTGKLKREIGKVDSVWWLKASPDDKYLMGQHRDGFWVMSVENGKQWIVKLDRDMRASRKNRAAQYHDSYRFVPGDTDWIMYWFERDSHPGGGLNKEGFRLRNFKTNEEKIIPFRFDWNHGDVGRYLGYHCSGYITRYENGTFQTKEGLSWFKKQFDNDYDKPHAIGGYAAHWPDDQPWAYACLYKRVDEDDKYLSEISKQHTTPFKEGGRTNRFRVCYNNLWGSGNDRFKNKSVGLMRPNMSPDGTKLIFNSNVFSKDGVYMVVCSLPMAPTHLEIQKRKAALTWRAPKYHAEIAGYDVYRSDSSGEHFIKINKALITDTKYTDTKAPKKGRAYYAVRSVEHSQLESPLSTEIAYGKNSKAATRIYCEAESAYSNDVLIDSPDELWVNFRGDASGLHYLWQRKQNSVGNVHLAVDLPGDGKYYIVARLKGKDGAQFTIANQEVQIDASNDWKWAESKGSVSLKAGINKISLSCKKYGSCIDSFYLCTDKGFKPKARILSTKPDALTLQGKSAGKHSQLSWNPTQSQRFHHYNIYCSANKNEAISQETLIASPDSVSYLDWQLSSGTWHYKVTQVNADGIESDPSNEVSISIP